MNWGELDDGEHTAVVYDNGVEFARSTFTVVRASEEVPFLQDVTAECTVPDFPDVGTNARFEWNTGTQHLELAEVGKGVVVPVSTQFDGEWDFVMELSQNILGEAICDCYSDVSSTTLSVENGEIFLGWYECEQRERVTIWSPIISPTGQLEGSFGQVDDEERYISHGSFNGFLFDDGTGGGSWIHIHGCAGSWFVQRREGS